MFLSVVLTKLKTNKNYRGQTSLVGVIQTGDKDPPNWPVMVPWTDKSIRWSPRVIKTRFTNICLIFIGLPTGLSHRGEGTLNKGDGRKAHCTVVILRIIIVLLCIQVFIILEIHML